METVIVKSKKDIEEYCKANGIQLEDFNQPVSIPDDVKICWYMFKGCKSFNQPVEIPNTAEDCMEMFINCESLNQAVSIPEGVVNVMGMFYNCSSLESPIKLPESATNIVQVFKGCKPIVSMFVDTENKDIATDASELIANANEKDKAHYSIKVIAGIREATRMFNLDEEGYLKRMHEDFVSGMSLEALHRKYDLIIVPFVEREVFEEVFSGR